MFRSIFFPCKHSVLHLVLIKCIEHFQGNSKIFAIFSPCMVTHSRQKRFVMQHRQCFARPKLFRLKKNKILAGIFYFQKKASGSEQPEFWNLDSKMPNQQPCMRPPLLGKGNCCVTRPGIRPPWLSEKIRTVRFAVFLQLLAYYLISLTCSWLIYCEHVQFPGKLLPDFHAFCSPGYDQRVNSTILGYANFKYDVIFSVILSETNYSHFKKNFIAVWTCPKTCVSNGFWK